MTPEERAAVLLDHPLLMEAAWTKQMRAALLPVVAAQFREAEAVEREACAKVADGFRYPANDVGKIDGLGDEADAIAAAIRARGNP